MPILKCNFNSVAKIYFLLAAIFKSQLLKMADTVMTVEFCTSYHNSSLEENAYAFLLNSFLQMQKFNEQCVNCDILV